MKKISFLLLFVTLLNCFVTQAYAGTLININFKKNSLAGNNYTGIAQSPSSGTYWNNLYTFNDTSVALKNSLNVNTSATVSYVFDSKPYGVTTLPATNLMNSYLDTGINKTGTMSFSGLTNGYYNVYVYSQGVTGTTTSSLNVSVNGTVYSTSNTSSSLTTFQLNKNYLVIPVSVTKGTLVMDYYGSATTSGYLNGLQLDYVAALPEPGSLMLLGVGGMIILVFLRLRSKDSMVSPS
jgi:hypothetical protein